MWSMWRQRAPARLQATLLVVTLSATPLMMTSLGTPVATALQMTLTITREVRGGGKGACGRGGGWEDMFRRLR